MNQIIEHLTDTKAIVASSTATVTSPWWLPSVGDISTAAALWLPIAGLVLVVLQILAFIWRNFRSRP